MHDSLRSLSSLFELCNNDRLELLLTVSWHNTFQKLGGVRVFEHHLSDLLIRELITWLEPRVI